MSHDDNSLETYKQSDIKQSIDDNYRDYYKNSYEKINYDHVKLPSLPHLGHQYNLTHIMLLPLWFRKKENLFDITCQSCWKQMGFLVRYKICVDCQQKIHLTHNKIKNNPIMWCPKYKFVLQEWIVPSIDENIPHNIFTITKKIIAIGDYMDIFTKQSHIVNTHQVISQYSIHKGDHSSISKFMMHDKKVDNDTYYNVHEHVNALLFILTHLKTPLISSTLIDKLVSKTARNVSLIHDIVPLFNKENRENFCVGKTISLLMYFINIVLDQNIDSLGDNPITEEALANIFTDALIYQALPRLGEKEPYENARKKTRFPYKKGLNRQVLTNLIKLGKIFWKHQMGVNSVIHNLDSDLKAYLPQNEFIKMRMNPSELIQKKVVSVAEEE